MPQFNLVENTIRKYRCISLSNEMQNIVDKILANIIKFSKNGFTKIKLFLSEECGSG